MLTRTRSTYLLKQVVLEDFEAENVEQANRLLRLAYSERLVDARDKPVEQASVKMLPVPAEQSRASDEHNYTL